MTTSGKFNSTRTLYGFKQLVVNDVPKVGLFTIDAEKIKEVEWIMEEFCQVASYERLVESCRKRGLRNLNGEEFTTATLRAMMSNIRYIGTWELNYENKDKDQKKLMPYDRYAVVDLPHGPAISMELWEKVQKTVAQVAKNRTIHKITKRTYPVSPLLIYEDGSTFAGQGAWSHMNTKHCYYWNRKHKIRLTADMIEMKVAEAIQDIIKKSTEMQEAIERRMQDQDKALQTLDRQLQTARAGLQECDLE